MNFFEHQERARRNTSLLVFYFVVAVALIVLTINAGVWGALLLAEAPGVSRDLPLAHPYWPAVTAGVLTVIVAGSLVSFIRLAGGGEAVAEMVGARRIPPGTTQPDERRLVNVVEEMSIASGTPVPAVYVMDGEAAINAFVAGYSIDRTVLVVTRGALEILDRDELQGVIAHEYSHILNGDMRLNVRLMSTLAGILLLGQLGGFLLRALRYGSSGRDRNSGALVLYLLGLGVALFVVGYVGLFFGRLIKAAVARQREFLADASAVQFTRNPAGIAGALWKIGEASAGSLLANRHAEDMNHMCFGDSVKVGFESLMATHPPLRERIRAIDPGFVARRVAGRAATAGVRAATPGSATPVPGTAAGFAGGGAVRTTPALLVDSVGNPGPAHIAYAGQLHGGLPAALLDAAHDASGARALLCALVLQESTASVDAAPGASPEAKALLDAAAGLGPAPGDLPAVGRLPLIEIALSTLRGAQAAERRAVVRVVKTLAASDRRLTNFELVLTVLLEKELLPPERGTGKVLSRFEPVLGDIRIALSALARAGAQEAAAATTYRRVAQGFDGLGLEPLPLPDAAPPRVAEALRRLAPLSPFLKRSLLNACADCVLDDGRVAPPEAELLRAIAAALDCPMPPVVAQSP